MFMNNGSFSLINPQKQPRKPEGAVKKIRYVLCTGYVTPQSHSIVGIVGVPGSREKARVFKTLNFFEKA